MRSRQWVRDTVHGMEDWVRSIAQDETSGGSNYETGEVTVDVEDGKGAVTFQYDGDYDQTPYVGVTVHDSDVSAAVTASGSVQATIEVRGPDGSYGVSYTVIG